MALRLGRLKTEHFEHVRDVEQNNQRCSVSKRLIFAIDWYIALDKSGGAAECVLIQSSQYCRF